MRITPLHLTLLLLSPVFPPLALVALAGMLRTPRADWIYR